MLVRRCAAIARHDRNAPGHRFFVPLRANPWTTATSIGYDNLKALSAGLEEFFESVFIA
jgi:hypothetical protein